MLPDLSPATRRRLHAAVCGGALLISACAAPPAPAPAPGPAVNTVRADTPASATPATPPSTLPAQPAPVPGPAAPPAPPPMAHGSDEPDAPVRGLLRLNDRLRGLSPAELTLEIAAQGDPGNDAARQMRLALTLMHSLQPVDTARALGLVQRVAASTADDAQPLRPLARLLAARLLEQRKLEDANERQAQQLRDQQRRIEQLTDRLEAMRAIERSLNTRPPAAPRTTPPATQP